MKKEIFLGLSMSLAPFLGFSTSLDSCSVNQVTEALLSVREDDQSVVVHLNDEEIDIENMIFIEADLNRRFTWSEVARLVGLGMMGAVVLMHIPAICIEYGMAINPY